MKILITKTEYKRIEKKIKVNIPDKQMYLWHNGVRMAYSIKPEWTSWNRENLNKPEEIYKLVIVAVDPSDNCIEIVELPISSLSQIVNDSKHKYQRLIDNILNYPNDVEYIRTKEQFENDLQMVLQNIKDSVAITPDTL